MFGGQMQLQSASDVALQFIDAARTPLDGAYGYNLGGDVVDMDRVAALIAAVVPGANITHADNVLPFPAGFDDAALRQKVPTVYETPLADGIRDTIESFRKHLAAGRMKAQSNV